MTDIFLRILNRSITASYVVLAVIFIRIFLKKSPLLSLSAKQSGLILPLGFGESNIKSRIKNILNYKKPGFWSLVVGTIVIIGLSTCLITNPIANKSERKAEEFLRIYYTIENTDIADKYHETMFFKITSSDYNTSKEGLEDLRKIDELILAKYKDLMTEDALNRAAANRVLLAGEMAAREYGSRLQPKKIKINKEKISDKGIISYDFDVEALVKLKDGTSNLVNLTGSIDMVELEETWKINNFKQSNLQLALKLKQANLYIINNSKASIRRVEVDTKGNSTGAMNADNTDMDKNYRFGFEVLDIPSLDYTVKLLDKDDKILLNQSFVGDFSDGKIIKLYIEEDANGDLSLQYE